ncbi:nucleoside triphosphate pyrophosphohydrolase family protein [Pasteurellaceae bacterium 20609_3]|uniref:nucleoside triphosphate pyrophosphohydrolase family protein n=1 Tax=Spirabiliibacterium mucosae TaxID=28156 RepID=UPI001AAD2650|nr:nucleoside triphosphate pyrophosphohydrolase family protein [Spirabiliibacterium mucosae]MBE2897805.1 nucleoside triphosphate pyrophosphohydrolase family protein [Spirabiliibacterium mucosae]
MTDITPILDWFRKAVPNPTAANVTTQIGCHFEEVDEMFEAIGITPTNISVVSDFLKNADEGYSNKIITDIDRTALLDSLCDQIVTAIGVAYMLGLDIQGALNEVNASNWSKFENGGPVFHPNGKIAKGKNYFEPKLEPFV